MMAVDVTVNPLQRFQPIDGFGSAMASYVGGLYNDAWSDMFYKDLGASILRMDLNVNALRGPDNDIATPVTMVEDIDANIAQFNFDQTRIKPFADIAKASLTKKVDDF